MKKALENWFLQINFDVPRLFQLTDCKHTVSVKMNRAPYFEYNFIDDGGLDFNQF